MRGSVFILLLSGALISLGLFLRKKSAGDLEKSGVKPSILKRLVVLLPAFFIVAGGWLFIKLIFTLAFGAPEKKELEVSVLASRVQILGLSISSTVLMMWVVMAVIFAGALFIRIRIVPRMADEPRGLQNVLELAVEKASGYTDSKTHGLGENLGAYIFTVGTLLIGCAVVELFGVRTPASDITMTFALALITFVLINYYGIRRKGLTGRVKSLASPTPMVFPLRLVSDLAIPVSLSCRLFGNMLGGMIVMDLLYSALGNAAIGIPSLMGLYFNVFHPVIQAYIFITLTLTFINEATE